MKNGGLPRRLLIVNKPSLGSIHATSAECQRQTAPHQVVMAMDAKRACIDADAVIYPSHAMGGVR